MMIPLRLGLDIGTTTVKAAAFDSQGRVVATETRTSAVSRPGPGRSEQDMEGVWATVIDVLGGLTAQLAGAQIGSLGISAQGDGLWPVDAEGKPAGPAMLWNDTRAAADVVSLNDSGRSASVGRACNTSLWPGTSGALWRWLKAEAPDTAARTAHVVTCGDWIGFKLTGMVATDYANASIPFLDLADRAYSDAALAALDCKDLADRLATPRRADALLGRVSDDIAQATGLPAGLPVSVATLDLMAMILGMRMDRPGQVMMIIGTTAVVNILVDSVVPSDLPAGASALHPTSPAIVRILAPTSGAAAFDWFAGLHPLSLGGENAGEIAAKLNSLVTEVPPGSNGVTFLPYLNGERAPFVAPDIAASFHGLTAASTKAEMGRAVMEGCALSLRHCFSTEGGLPDRPVLLTGGGSKNPVWCQIIADVIGIEVVVSEASDQGLWGAACLGAAAAGTGPVMDLVAAREDPDRIYAPSPEAHRAYGTVFDRYLALSDAMRAVTAQLAHRKETS